MNAVVDQLVQETYEGLTPGESASDSNRAGSL